MYNFTYHRPETLRQAVNLLGKNEDAKLLAAVTAHERALLAYSERELAGTAGVLEPVMALLKVVPSRSL